MGRKDYEFQIKHGHGPYCKELLSDGREHSISEIQSYINRHTGEKGIDGMLLSGQVVYSTLAHGFERTGRGIYRDPSAGIQQDETPRTETEKLLHGLRRVDEALSEAFTRNYRDLPLSGEKLQELFAIVIQFRSLIRQARELAVPAVQQTAVEDQGGPEQETKGPGMGPMM